MHTDSFYQIGHGHAVCQDFALSGKIPDTDIHFGIVCDGCSQSGDKFDVDFGARILAYAARKAVFNMHKYFSDFWKKDDYDIKDFLAPLIISEIKSIQKELGLPDSVFDCTLIILLHYDGLTTSCWWGDGFGVTKYENGFCITKHEYGSNAPFYLSYYLDPSRLERYIAENDPSDKDKGLVSTSIAYDYNSENGFVERNKSVQSIHRESITAFYHNPYHHALGKIVSMSVASDGFGTYFKVCENGDQVPIPFDEVCFNQTLYKSYKGIFVQRRMNKYAKDCEKNDIKHFDDISCATIYLGDE